MRRIALAACCLVALSPLSSCSSADTPPTSAGGSTAGDELAAARAFAALPPAEQTAQLQSVTESIDRQLMTMSGLEAELGGAAKADAAYAALSAKARQFAQSLVDQPDFGKFGAFVPAEDAPTTGGLMFANYMAGALLQDAAVNQAKDVPAGTKAEPQSEDLNDPNSAGKGAIKATGDMKQSSLEVGGEITVDGITGKLKTVITVAPCPDAKGQFTSTTTMTANVTSAGGSTGSNLTVEVAIKGQVDDDAQLASHDVDSRTESAKFENSKGQPHRRSRHRSVRRRPKHVVAVHRDHDAGQSARGGQEGLAVRQVRHPGADDPTGEEEGTRTVDIRDDHRGPAEQDRRWSGWRNRDRDLERRSLRESRRIESPC
jgi:hypothetical protein